MPDGGTLRARIHSTWEAFFPSALYCALFVVAFILIVPSTTGSDRILALAGQLRAFKASETYTLLSELELHKTLPFFALLLFAAAIYLFDRMVTFVGNIFPPFVEWHGSMVLYVPRHLVINLWALLPESERAYDLHARSRAIIDAAILEGKTLPPNSREYLQQRRNKAGSALAYTKAGAMWVLVALAIAVVTGGYQWGSFGWALTFIVGFALSTMLNIARLTSLMIKSAENDMYLAAELLRARGEGDLGLVIDSKMVEDFEQKLAQNMSRAPRMVRLVWRRNRNWGSLRAAFFGFRALPVVRDISSRHG